MEENMPGVEKQPQPNPEAFHTLLNPDMDAGIFKAYIAGPDGFKLNTRFSLLRHNPLQIPEMAETIQKPEEISKFLENVNKNRHKITLGLTESDKDLLGDRMKDPIDGELRFTTALEAQKILKSLREEKDPVKKELLQRDYELARIRYVNVKNAPKVGLRNIIRRKTPEGDLISFDIKPVTFPVSKNFAKPNAKPEVLNFSESAATSMILITGDNKILVTHRALTNEVYPDMIGASIAGAFDGVFERQSKQKGTLKPITETDVLTNIRKEAKEELGIDDEHLKKEGISLIGLAEEITPYLHHEFLYLGRTEYSSKQIRENASKTERARQKNLTIHDIEGKFDFIDATPEAIFTLLTKVVSPIPHTHVANYAVLGYRLVLERDGKETADRWKRGVEEGIQRNIAAINKTVSDYYEKNPKIFESIPERLIKKVETAVLAFKNAHPNSTAKELEEYRQKRISYLPKRNRNAYSYELTPSEQGLPDYDTAMQESGLIKTS